MIEAALRSQLLANCTITALVGNRIYVGDTPGDFNPLTDYPYVRISGSGENNKSTIIRNCLIESVSIDIFTKHSPKDTINGFPDSDTLTESIRQKFDAWTFSRLTDGKYNFDVRIAKYRDFQNKINSEANDLQKPITITFEYNLIKIQE